MAEIVHKEKLKELKEMIERKKKDESTEKILVNFCERHGLSLKACKIYYDQLVKNGEINAVK